MAEGVSDILEINDSNVSTPKRPRGSPDGDLFLPATKYNKKTRKAIENQRRKASPKHLEDILSESEFSFRTSESDDSLENFQPSPSPQPSTPKRQEPTTSSQKPQTFILEPTEGWKTEAETLIAIQIAHPGLRVKRQYTRTGCIKLTPKDEETAICLKTMKEVNGKPVLFKELHQENRTHTAVALRVPHQVPAETLIQLIPQIKTSVRLEKWDSFRKEPIMTKSCKITWEGPTLPHTLDVGLLGTFELRPFVPEPLRCYKCQRYRHIARNCMADPRCGICAGAHPTRSCLERRTKGETVPLKCANCGKGHCAASLACPVRKEQARAMQPKQIPSQERIVPPQQASQTVEQQAPQMARQPENPGPKTRNHATPAFTRQDLPPRKTPTQAKSQPSCKQNLAKRIAQANVPKESSPKPKRENPRNPRRWESTMQAQTPTIPTIDTVKIPEMTEPSMPTIQERSQPMTRDAKKPAEDQARKGGAGTLTDTEAMKTIMTSLQAAVDMLTQDLHPESPVHAVMKLFLQMFTQLTPFLAPK